MFKCNLTRTYQVGKDDERSVPCGQMENDTKRRTGFITFLQFLKNDARLPITDQTVNKLTATYSSELNDMSLTGSCVTSSST